MDNRKISQNHENNENDASNGIISESFSVNELYADFFVRIQFNIGFQQALYHRIVVEMPELITLDWSNNARLTSTDIRNIILFLQEAMVPIIVFRLPSHHYMSKVSLIELAAEGLKNEGELSDQLTIACEKAAPSQQSANSVKMKRQKRYPTIFESASWPRSDKPLVQRPPSPLQYDNSIDLTF